MNCHPLSTLLNGIDYDCVRTENVDLKLRFDLTTNMLESVQRQNNELTSVIEHMKTIRRNEYLLRSELELEVSRLRIENRILLNKRKPKWPIQEIVGECILNGIKEYKVKWGETWHTEEELNNKKVIQKYKQMKNKIKIQRYKKKYHAQKEKIHSKTFDKL